MKLLLASSIQNKADWRSFILATEKMLFLLLGNDFWGTKPRLRFYFIKPYKALIFQKDEEKKDENKDKKAEGSKKEKDEKKEEGDKDKKENEKVQ